MHEGVSRVNASKGPNIHTQREGPNTLHSKKRGRNAQQNKTFALFHIVSQFVHQKRESFDLSCGPKQHRNPSPGPRAAPPPRHANSL